MKKLTVLTVGIAAAIFVALPVASAHAQQARVYVQQSCPTDPTANGQEKESAALAAVVVTKVVGEVVGAMIDGLAAELSTAKQVAHIATERKPNWYVKAGQGGYLIDPQLTCVVVVVAKELGIRNANLDSQKVSEHWRELGHQLDYQGDAAFIKLRGAAAELANMGITGIPDFYLEARFHTLSSGNAVFALDPKFVWYPKFLGEKVVFGTDTRDVMVKFEFSEPGETSPFASVQYAATNVTTNQFARQLINMRTPWSKQPQTASANDGTGGLVPFNIKLLFTETAQPGKLGQVIAKVATESKAAIVTEVENKTKLALSAAERQAARNSAAEAANTALTAYVAAYDGYTKAKQAVLVAGTAIPFDQAALQKAKNVEELERFRLRNAEALAVTAFSDAGIPFTPLPI